MRYVKMVVHHIASTIYLPQDKLYYNLINPNAYDIFNIFCKTKDLDLIYDAKNCEPLFRLNAMIRARNIGKFNKFKLEVVVPHLNYIKSNIDSRNKKLIRQTPISEFIKGLNELLKLPHAIRDEISDTKSEYKSYFGEEKDKDGNIKFKKDEDGNIKFKLLADDEQF